MSDKDRPRIRLALAASGPSSGPIRAADARLGSRPVRRRRARHLAARPARRRRLSPPQPPPRHRRKRRRYAAAKQRRPSTIAEEWIASAAPPPQRAAGRSSWSRPCASTISSPRTQIRSCARPGRCCCCSAVCASRLLRASFASLMEQVADAIKFFEKDIRSAGISEAAGEQRQIHPLRHRRRHRSEYPDRGSPRLDAIQHAEPLFRRAHRRRAVLRDLNHAQAGSAGQLSACWNCSTPVSRSASRASIAPRPAASRRCSKFNAIFTRRCAGFVPRSSRDLSPRWQGQSWRVDVSRVARSGLGGGGLRRLRCCSALFVTLRILLSGSAERGG